MFDFNETLEQARTRNIRDSLMEDMGRNDGSQGESNGQRSSQGSSRSGSQAHYGGQGLYSQGDHGQGQFGQGPATGHQGQYGGQSSYRSSRPEDRDQYRGGYSRTSHPYSSAGASGSPLSGSKSHGPYSGKGPKGYKRSDQQICEEANQALERDGRVDASEIEVSCTGGVLKLTGKVENRAAKRDAEECVESVYGVSDVMNELKVENGFFANLFGTGSSADSSEHKNAPKSSNKSSQNNL